jgi:transcriptional regulator NrdR family protein
MTYDEKEDALLLKNMILIEQRGICPVCEEEFTVQDQIQAAHRICKSKVNLKKYGKEIIHHRLNLACTHDVCNSSVLINPEAQTGKDLIQLIKEDLENQ